MTVHITINGEDGEDVRAQLAQLLNISAPLGASAPVGMLAASGAALNQIQTAGATLGATATASEAGAHGNTVSEPAKPATARRTKAQIAADNEKEAAAEKAAAAAQQAISTNPENRVGPEDDPAVDAQDAADEAAEKTGADLTIDDVKASFGQYIKTYSLAAAQEDVPKMLQLAFGPGVVKQSDIPLDQASLKKAVAGTMELIAKNPFKRELATPKDDAPKA